MPAFRALPLGWPGSCSDRKKRVRTGHQKLPAQQAGSVFPSPRNTRQCCTPCHPCCTLILQQEHAAVLAMRRQQLRGHLARGLSLRALGTDGWIVIQENRPAARPSSSCSPTSVAWQRKCNQADAKLARGHSHYTGTAAVGYRPPVPTGGSARPWRGPNPLAAPEALPGAATSAGGVGCSAAPSPARGVPRPTVPSQRPAVIDYRSSLHLRLALRVQKCAGPHQVTGCRWRSAGEIPCGYQYGFTAQKHALCKRGCSQLCGA